MKSETFILFIYRCLCFSGNESKNSVVDLWQVVGDVTSSMSTVSRNVGREDKLKGKLPPPPLSLCPLRPFLPIIC